jgi:2-haloacid dehalogenase
METRRRTIRNSWGGTGAAIVAEDVNETLIDFESMDGLFERIFGDERVLREWFGHLVMYSMTITLSGLYKDYWRAGCLSYRGRHPQDRD